MEDCQPTNGEKRVLSSSKNLQPGARGPAPFLSTPYLSQVHRAPVNQFLRAIFDAFPVAAWARAAAFRGANQIGVAGKRAGFNYGTSFLLLSLDVHSVLLG